MPKSDRVALRNECSRPETFGEFAVDRIRERLQQPQLSFGRNDRHRLDNAPSAGAQAGDAGEYRVADVPGDLFRVSGEDFRYEERVAGRHAVEIVRIGFVWLRERCDSKGGEPR